MAFSQAAQREVTCTACGHSFAPPYFWASFIAAGDAC